MKFMIIAALLAVSACTEGTPANNNVTIENVAEPDANVSGPCGDGTFPKGRAECE